MKEKCYNTVDKIGIVGWLSREGNFYECKETKHNFLASKIEKDLNLKVFDEEKNIYLHDTALLDALGFVKFTRASYDFAKDYCDSQFVLFNGTRFSYAQRKWMEQNILKMTPDQRTECRKRLIRGY